MELARYYDEIQALDAEVLGISSDDLSGARNLVATTGINLPVLYDPSGDVARMFGVHDLLGDGMAAPSAFIVDKQGVLRWKYVGSSISDRASTEKILDQL